MGKGIFRQIGKGLFPAVTAVQRKGIRVAFVRCNLCPLTVYQIDLCPVRCIRPLLFALQLERNAWLLVCISIRICLIYCKRLFLHSILALFDQIVRRSTGVQRSERSGIGKLGANRCLPVHLHTGNICHCRIFDLGKSVRLVVHYLSKSNCKALCVSRCDLFSFLLTVCGIIRDRVICSKCQLLILTAFCLGFHRNGIGADREIMRCASSLCGHYVNQDLAVRRKSRIGGNIDFPMQRLVILRGIVCVIERIAALSFHKGLCDLVTIAHINATRTAVSLVVRNCVGNCVAVLSCAICTGSGCIGFVGKR